MKTRITAFLVLLIAFAPLSGVAAQNRAQDDPIAQEIARLEAAALEAGKEVGRASTHERPLLAGAQRGSRNLLTIG